MTHIFVPRRQNKLPRQPRVVEVLSGTPQIGCLADFFVLAARRFLKESSRDRSNMPLSLALSLSLEVD